MTAQHIPSLPSGEVGEDDNRPTPLGDRLREIAAALITDCKLAADFEAQILSVAECVGTFERTDGRTLTREAGINECMKAIKEAFGPTGGHCGESTSEIISRQRYEKICDLALHTLETLKTTPIGQPWRAFLSVEPYRTRLLDLLDKRFRQIQQLRAALTASEAERERMREAIVSVIADMETGFVKCERCGSQEDTKDLDFIFDLRAALDSTP